MQVRFAGASVLTIVVIGLLGACSASEYQKPIEKFAKATGETQSAVDGYNKALVDAKKNFVRNSAVAEPGLVRPLPGECTAGAASCRYGHYRSPNDPNPALLTPERPMARLAALMQAFADYANNLSAIAKGTEAGDVEASVQSTGDSLSKIAALAPGSGSGSGSLASYVTPVSAVVGWGLGLYVDSVKLDALKTAVAKADPIIARAGEVGEAEAEQATEAIKAYMRELVSTRSDTYRARRSRENLDKLADAADAYDAFLREGATPSSVFKDFVKAHADLNSALNSRKVSLADLTKQMAAFQTRAEKLVKILKDVEAANKAK